MMRKAAFFWYGVRLPESDEERWRATILPAEPTPAPPPCATGRDCRVLVCRDRQNGS